MSHFGNNRANDYTAKSYQYEPKWEKFVDYCPDHRPSTSGMFIEDGMRGVLWVLPVFGLGALVMRAESNPDGEMVFMGVSTFTDCEIGHRK